MVTKIGINGFGRIGRMCLRAALQNEKVQVVAVNSTSDAEQSAHLLKYDSIHGKLNGVSVRVPVPNVSLIDLVVELEQDITVEKINAALKQAAKDSMQGIVEYCETPLVSIDFLDNSHSAIIDAPSTMVVGQRTAKILAWYDNEWGYSCRVVDLATFMGERLADANEPLRVRNAG